MVIGDAENPGKMLPQPSAMPSPANIDNIMSGISNTGSVKMNNHRKKLRQRFDIIKKLGQGTYGKVQLGINKETGQEVAIKTIKKCKIETEADLIRIRREVQIMSSVQHPNIIHIYEVFENREKMVLVMEFAAGGELYDYLSERKVLSEDEARRVFRQISTAVYYCHKHKICHRDLKLENILLDENGNAKIADFGLSNVFDEQRQLATFCGSPLYASPEIVKGTPYQGPEVDCWSLGVLLYTLVYGAMPFDGSNFKRLVKQISSGDYYEPKKPSPASPLIREMLTVCPKRRASIENICNHWWVNEGYKESCLDLAEELANQTPVRLDVLLSLAPPSVTADQLVVPGSNEEAKPADRVARSHSVGSIRDMGNTEAERRILDMVAAGGEAALAPSPTRTITPAESPAQAKRKLESTVSTESVHGGAKKKEKPTELLRNDPSRIAIAEDMEVEQVLTDVQVPQAETIESKKVEDVICDKQLESSESFSNLNINKTNVVEQKPEFKFEKSLTKSTTKDTSDTTEAGAFDEKISPQRKNSLTEESLIKNNERRKSRIFEAAEKFQNMSNLSSDKPKKFVLPGVSVGGFKKEFERKASLTSIPTPGERKSLEKRSESLDQTISRKNSLEENADHAITPVETKILNEEKTSPNDTQSLKSTENKGSLANFSLEEARRSMENSIALLNAAKTESSKELDQLCAQTEDVAVSEDGNERQQKLKLARETIGNAIKPGRLCMGVRKPPVPFGLNGRSVSGSVVPSSTLSPVGDMRSMRLKVGPEPSDIRTANFSVSSPEHRLYNKEPLVQQKPSAFGVGIADPQNNNMKTSRAEITLKSATLPRRKPAKSEIQFELLPKQEQPSMRFQTEIQHQLPDLRSAPIREHSGPYSPLEIQNRASSLEPQKEHVIPIQRPQTSYSRTGSNSFKPTLSRQSTNDSDTESTATMTTASQSTITGSKSGASQPIKKSPREFIIPIAVEGGGFLTPRAGSLEPSESNSTAGGSFSSRISRQRRIGSLLNDRDSEDENPFSRLHRHTSLNRDSDIDDQPRFAMHRLRSTRPIKKSSTDPNDSASSGEEDDDDGFEILTAENLFSTLLSRVRALTNRLNVNNDPSSSFPSSRLMSNLRQPHSPFWHNDPFASKHYSYTYRSETINTKETRLNNGSNSWRHSMARDLTSDIDSMFSRSGATLPRVGFRVSLSHVQSPPNPISAGVTKNHTIKQTETESL